MSRVVRHRGLGLVLGLYVILAVTYSIVVPIGRGADEWAHYWYAQFIAHHGRLPANPAEREAAGYKSDWPPLYHVFAAGLTAWVDTDGPPTFKYRLDNIRRQLVPAFGPEAILHTEDEQFPWQQEILVWHLGRFLSIVFSLGTLFVTYFLALDIFSEFRTHTTTNTLSRSSQIPNPKSQIQNLQPFDFTQDRSPISNLQSPIPNPKSLALASVAVLAFNPRFLFTGMLFNYDSLTLLISSLFLWLAIRVAKGYYLRRGFWALGALAGLALVTKYLTALLPLTIILVALIVSHREFDQTEGVPLAARIRRLLTRSFLIRLLQAGLAFVLVTSWWFAYLLINFNEIETYGPVLGSVAPLLRGDGSDRTVEAIFAFLGGDRTPTPDFIEKQDYPAWQIMAELLTTFWGNPIIRPYPLNWFVIVMTGVVFVAAIGLGLAWRESGGAMPGSNARSALRPRSILAVLLLQCLLPVPFMVIRLFGARDALEAVQGRHILFLAGPAIAVLLVWGLSEMIRFTIYDLRFTIYDYSFPAFHFSLSALLALLLSGAAGQLIFMKQTYPPLLPVRTTAYRQTGHLLSEIELAGGAQLIDFNLENFGPSLNVALIWRGGEAPPPEDYLMELALVDPQGQTKAGWLAYQTQAHYPTRTWEPGDVIRDEAWLPLTGLPAGDYELRMRLLGQAGEAIPWQTLASYHHAEAGPSAANIAWHLLYQGEVRRQPPILHERETVQLTQSKIQNPKPKTQNPHLTGPDDVPRAPVSAGPTWANFIIQPDWPAGDYRLQNENEVVLRVAPNDRDFTVPAEMTVPLEANFAGQIKLLGYHLPTRRVQPGEGLPVTLYWQGLRWLAEDFVIFDRLLDNQQVAWGGYDRLARENYSTLLWAPGEIVTDGFAVPVAADAPDGIYTLNLGWYLPINGRAEALPVLNPETGQPGEVTSITLGPIKVGGPPPNLTVTDVRPQKQVDVVLGDQIKLLGVDLAHRTNGSSPNDESSENDTPFGELSDAEVSEPNIIDLTFYWEAIVRPEADYTVFVHIRNQAGVVVAQMDRPPADGAYPTSLWESGEIIPDQVAVPLAGRLPPDQYTVVVGLYDFNSGTRLPVAGSVDNSIKLATLELQP